MNPRGCCGPAHWRPAGTGRAPWKRSIGCARTWPTSWESIPRPRRSHCTGAWSAGRPPRRPPRPRRRSPAARRSWNGWASSAAARGRLSSQAGQARGSPASSPSSPSAPEVPCWPPGRCCRNATRPGAWPAACCATRSSSWATLPTCSPPVPRPSSRRCSARIPGRPPRSIRRARGRCWWRRPLGSWSPPVRHCWSSTISNGPTPAASTRSRWPPPAPRTSSFCWPSAPRSSPRTLRCSDFSATCERRRHRSRCPWAGSTPPRSNGWCTIRSWRPRSPRRPTARRSQCWR